MLHEPFGRTQRTACEDAAVFGAVRQGQALFIAGKDDIVLPGHRTAAQRGETDGPFVPLARLPVAAAFALTFELYPTPRCSRFAQQQRSAARRVDFHAVMHLDDLDIPIGAEAGCRLLHQMGKKGHPQRGVTGLQHRNRMRRAVDRLVMAFRKPGRADDDGNASPDGGMEIAIERLWR